MNRDDDERAKERIEAERRRALDLFARLESCEPEDRRFLLETCPEYQTWALVELLGDRSEVAASDDTAAALELAGLAQYLAERVRGDKVRRQVERLHEDLE